MRYTDRLADAGIEGVQRRRPSARICRCVVSSKTLPMHPKDYSPLARVNVSAVSINCRFEVSINCRFWVSTEA